MKSVCSLAYGGAPGGKSPLLDLHLPENGAILSTYVYFHGGGLTTGSRDDAEVLALAKFLTQRGVAVVSADYRLYPDGEFPGFIQDAARAVRWTMDHLGAYGLPCRVYVGGSSAGGYLSMMLCFARKYLEGAGLAPENMAGFLFDAGQPTTHFEVLSRRGADPRRVLVDEAAPLFYVRDERPAKPLLMIFAENDMPGRPEQTLLLIRTLLIMGYDNGLIERCVMKGCSHCEYLNPENGEAFYAYADRCAAFLTA